MNFLVNFSGKFDEMSRQSLCYIYCQFLHPSSKGNFPVAPQELLVTPSSLQIFNLYPFSVFLFHGLLVSLFCLFFSMSFSHVRIWNHFSVEHSIFSLKIPAFHFLCSAMQVYVNLVYRNNHKSKSHIHHSILE